MNYKLKLNQVWKAQKKASSILVLVFMNKLLKFFIAIIFIIVVFIISSILVYNYEISAVSKESNIVEFEVVDNSTYLSISKALKDKNLIKSELFYKVYVKLNKPSNLQKGKYVLDKNMNVEKIIDVLSKGNNYNPDTITLTFKEGINMRGIVKVIVDNTNNKEEDIYALLSNENYLDELINKYWFITDEVKNKDIYYSLEGYLYPDTYEYVKDATVKEILSKMLDRMDEVLTVYKSDLQNSKYSIHQILTLASIVELEAGLTDDRAGVAGVFYNRLNNNYSLGSDVTTYYAAKIDMSERDLYQSELNSVNGYNTRSSAMAGKLPIGPICIPSSESINAVLNPAVHNYFYFVADKNKKTYFNENYDGHIRTINKLKAEGLWYTY